MVKPTEQRRTHKALGDLSGRAEPSHTQSWSSVIESQTATRVGRIMMRFFRTNINLSSHSMKWLNEEGYSKETGSNTNAFIMVQWACSLKIDKMFATRQHQTFLQEYSTFLENKQLGFHHQSLIFWLNVDRGLWYGLMVDLVTRVHSISEVSVEW